MVEALRALAPVAALGVGLLYGLGYLVTSAYVAGFGGAELEPLRARYVSVGFMFGYFVSVPLVAGAMAWRTVRRLWSSDILGRVARLALSVVAVVGLAAIVFMAEFFVLGAAKLEEPLTAMWRRQVPTLVSWNLWVAGAAALYLVFQLALPSPPTLRQLLPALLLVGFGLGLILFYVVSVYPQVPTWIGGGRLQRVGLVVTDSERICATCDWENHVFLIDEDSSRVLVLAGPQPETLALGAGMRPYLISRSRVLAIVFRESQR